MVQQLPQPLIDMYNTYIHGGMTRREFVDATKKFAVGGLTVAAIMEGLMPNYALGEVVPKNELLAAVRSGGSLLGAWQGEQMLAGVIANETAGVVGLSNLFVGDVDRDAAGIWAGAVAAITAHFPGSDLVGYEGGDDLVMARSAGFEPTGLLRVWAR